MALNQVQFAFEKFAPATLFPRFLASQLSEDARKGAWVLKACTPQILSVDVRTALTRSGVDSWDSYQVSLQDGCGLSVVIQIASTSVGILTQLCCLLDQVIRRDFVGLESYVTEVVFDHLNEKQTWLLRKGQSLISLLKCRQWDKCIDSYPRKNLLLRDVIGTVKPAVFLSHCWQDKNETFLEEIAEAIELETREFVWWDKTELANAQDFSSRMEEGITNSRCVIIFLSRAYLSSRSCLFELSVAMREHLSRGTLLRVIAVEPEVSFERIQGWEQGAKVPAASINGRYIHSRTVQWVKRYLLGININVLSLQSTENSEREARRSIVRSLLGSFHERQHGMNNAMATDFEIGEDDGCIYLWDRTNTRNPWEGLINIARNTHHEPEKSRVIAFCAHQSRDVTKVHGELQLVIEDFKLSHWWKTFELDIYHMTTFDSFRHVMIQAPAQNVKVVYFTGHSDSDGSLCFANDQRGWDLKSQNADLIASTIEMSSVRNTSGGIGTVECVVLNEGNTFPLAMKLRKRGLLHVICWKSLISVRKSSIFAEWFFKHLVAHVGDYKGAFKSGLNAVTSLLHRTSQDRGLPGLCFLSVNEEDNFLEPSDAASTALQAEVCEGAIDGFAGSKRKFDVLSEFHDNYEDLLASCNSTKSEHPIVETFGTALKNSRCSSAGPVLEKEGPSRVPAKPGLPVRPTSFATKPILVNESGNASQTSEFATSSDSQMLQDWTEEQLASLLRGCGGKPFEEAAAEVEHSCCDGKTFLALSRIEPPPLIWPVVCADCISL